MIFYETVQARKVHFTNKTFFNDTDIIKVITGIRRCGKSSLLQTIAEELMESGVSKNNIFFYNLDKYGYKNIKTPEALEELLFGGERPEGIKYEVGSIYTIQGFDLAYAGVIIGPSIYYDPNEKRIKVNTAENCCEDMKGSIKTSDGTDLDVEEFLIKNELRVLLTRGTKGLYIYACDSELRKALVDALK